MKTILLPRQARDKHRESTQKKTVFADVRIVLLNSALLVRKTPFVRRFYLKTIILPRQAQAKHEGRRSKKKAFCAECDPDQQL
jgi:hypothetical protein